ncbi:MAG: CarD family transcriptional regulator [Oscillospiraceae bacterium]|nr:CarD family transcriptional regulator [Oscillospiraceae bacterium]
MYQPGELIIYNGEGVCRVDCVGPVDLSGANKNKLYYTLQPVYREGKIYIPVDSPVFMRPVITKAEAETLIRRLPEIPGEIYENRNLRMLNEHYQELMQTHDCEDMFQLIKAVYAKQREMQAQGRKPGLVDERYMKRAEDILYGELAIALDIQKSSVPDYISSVLDG